MFFIFPCFIGFYIFPSVRTFRPQCVTPGLHGRERRPPLVVWSKYPRAQCHHQVRRASLLFRYCARPVPCHHRTATVSRKWACRGRRTLVVARPSQEFVARVRRRLIRTTIVLIWQFTVCSQPEKSREVRY